MSHGIPVGHLYIESVRNEMAAVSGPYIPRALIISRFQSSMVRSGTPAEFPLHGPLHGLGENWRTPLQLYCMSLHFLIGEFKE